MENRFFSTTVITPGTRQVMRMFWDFICQRLRKIYGTYTGLLMGYLICKGTKDVIQNQRLFTKDLLIKKGTLWLKYCHYWLIYLCLSSIKKTQKNIQERAHHDFVKTEKKKKRPTKSYEEYSNNKQTNILSNNE